MAGNNITATTRELWDPTRVAQVLMRNAVLARIMQERRFIMTGGTKYRTTVQKAGLASVGQTYRRSTTQLTNQDKELFEYAEWELKDTQLPVQYDMSEKMENSAKEQIVPLVASKLAAAQEGLRTLIKEAMYTDNSTVLAGSGDSAVVAVQSLIDGCGLVRTGSSYAYGTIQSSTTSNVWWNGASLLGTFADQATTIPSCLQSFREMLSACRVWKDAPAGEWLAVVAPPIFRALQNEVDGRAMITGRELSGLAKLGFPAFVYDGIEFVQEDYLERNALDATTSPGAVNATRNKYALLLHMPSWKLIIHRERNLTLTEAFWQGNVSGGFDYWLQRVLARINLVTVQPNASMFRSNMT